MGARPYDPSLGRFLAVDPVDGGSLNNYDYAGQDPINGYDLAGTMEDEGAVVEGAVHDAIEAAIAAYLANPESWDGVPTFKVATRDFKVYRVYGGKARANGQWVSRERFSNGLEAKQRLSLPSANTAQLQVEITVKKGDVYIEGRASAQFGWKGGGNQIYLVNRPTEISPPAYLEPLPGDEGAAGEGWGDE